MDCDPPVKLRNLDARCNGVGLVQLKAVDPAEFERNWSKSEPFHFEPEIPFSYVHWEEYQAEEQFDVVCLTRSPNFTPEAADRIYDEIRARFIDEAAWA